MVKDGKLWKLMYRNELMEAERPGYREGFPRQWWRETETGGGCDVGILYTWDPSKTEFCKPLCFKCVHTFAYLIHTYAYLNDWTINWLGLKIPQMWYEMAKEHVLLGNKWLLDPGCKWRSTTESQAWFFITEQLFSKSNTLVY